MQQASAWTPGGSEPTRRAPQPDLATAARGGSYGATDGWIDPPRNVLAYTLAMQQAGVEVRERTTFPGLRPRPRAAGVGAHGVQTTAARSPPSACVLTGGPTLPRSASGGGADPRGRRAAPGGRDRAAPDLAADRLPMVFDIGAGIYWRPEEGGCCGGCSNPDERPGEASEFDWAYSAVERGSHTAAGHRGPRAAQGLGGDDRLHPRPPADPRPGSSRRRPGRRAPRGRAPAATG